MWHVGTASSCPTDLPYALINSQDGSVGGCYATREAANAGIGDMDVDEDGEGIGHQPSGIQEDPVGIKPEPRPNAVPSGLVGIAIGNQTPWTKNPTMYTTPSTQIW